MTEGKSAAGAQPLFHSHVFLGEGHEKSERRTWAVIWLCAAMMALEIVGGWLFGSIALVADGLHMSTHAGRSSWRRSRTPSRDATRTTRASLSAPAKLAIWPATPAPSSWR